MASGKGQLSKKSEADNVDLDDADKLQNNYDSYEDSDGLTKENNPISNSFRSLEESI
jgi:hypothetical protein